MGEPAFPTREEKQQMARLAAEAFDAVNEDREDEYRIPSHEMVWKILIQYARLIGLR